MWEPIEPVQASRPASGLVATAETFTDAGRWMHGMAWRSERCPQVRGMNPACGIETPFSPLVGEGDDLNYYLPPAFRVEEICATRGGPIDEMRVRRQAEAVTSFVVARELHDGALTRSAPYESPAGPGQVNAFLAEAPEVEPGTWDPYAGLGRIEQLARESALGQDVFIHMPVELVPLVANALVQRGNLLYTQAGARVVADAGYTGGGTVSAGTAEVQTVTITGAPTGGTFTLTHDGNTTGPIAYNATAVAVQAALLALPHLESGDLTVTGAGPYTVTWNAELGNVTQMTASGAGLTGGTAPAVGVATTTPGVAPAAAAGSWIYATGPVQVRLGPIAVERINDWPNNQVIMVAERMFAATFDRCNVHALELDVPASS